MTTLKRLMYVAHVVDLVITHHQNKLPAGVVAGLREALRLLDKELERMHNEDEIETVVDYPPINL